MKTKNTKAMPRLGPRKRRGDPDETALRLVIAAAKEFNERGYYSTDSNRIAERAGYSPGTFYKHFGDKRAVFLAAYAWWVKAIWADVEQAFVAEATDETARARGILSGIVRTHREWLGFRRDLKHLAATDDEVRRFYLARRKEQLDGLLALSRARGDDRARGTQSTPRRAEAALVLFSIERAADAIADGEASALGVNEGALLDGLTQRIVELGPG